jgi:hypothetical protein
MSLRHTQGNGFRLSSTIDKGRDVYFKNYSRDGIGRDNYIASNNGGLYANYYSPSKGISIGSGLYIGKG